jgi:glycosyltransferase involved in cell wall biosynthesis
MMDLNYDFCFLITTYNRGNMLYDLINQIESQIENQKVLIVVFDDGSIQNYNFNNPQIKYIKFFPNQGKKKYWRIINTIFKYVQNINSKYFIQIPDDILLIDNFLNIATDFYEKISDPNKICLSILTDGRVYKHNWTSFNSIDMGNYIKTQWNDLCYISTKEFFKQMDFKIDEIPMSRWKQNPNLSSGVGQQISLKLHNKNKSMYHTKTSLVIHGNHISKMNFDERKNQPIITI